MAEATGATRKRNPRGEGDRLRDELIDAAVQLIDAGAGAQAITIRGVTRVAGTSPQSFYRHFRQLGDFLWAVYERLWAAFDEQLQTVPTVGQLQPVERLDALCDGYLAFAEARAGAHAFLFTASADAPRGWSPGAGARLPGARVFERWRTAVHHAGIDDTDAAAVTAALWSGLEGAVQLRAAMPAFPWPEPVQASARRLRRALVPG